MSSEKIEEAVFEEIPQIPENVQQVEMRSVGFIQEDDDEEESNSTIEDVKKLTDVTAQYRKTDISQGDVFVDPQTGEILDRLKLPILEQIKIAARSMGQTINEPNKNCKKCHGRGYTGFNLAGNIPVACDCIYVEYYKNNPEVKQKNYFPELNRKAKRQYDKAMSKYITEAAKRQQRETERIEKSKANLRKNTKKEDTIETENL